MEKSALLRALNYQRVRHGYAIRYNLIYPALVAIASVWAINAYGSLSDEFEVDGFVRETLSILSILAPFFIASLAAVATFDGPADFDEPFKMSSPLTLTIVGKGGEWALIHPTQRHFLSLLFGYCATLAIFLLLFVILSPTLSSPWFGISTDAWWYAQAVSMILFVFFLTQLVLSMMLGIYYLADRLHRV